jgi:hypothetical protein
MTNRGYWTFTLWLHMHIFVTYQYFAPPKPHLSGKPSHCLPSGIGEATLQHPGAETVLTNATPLPFIPLLVGLLVTQNHISPLALRSPPYVTGPIFLYLLMHVYTELKFTQTRPAQFITFILPSHFSKLFPSLGSPRSRFRQRCRPRHG